MEGRGWGGDLEIEPNWPYTSRDWAVAVGGLLAALATVVTGVIGDLTADPLPAGGLLVLVDAVAGVCASAALLLSRRFPASTALAVIAVSLIATTAAAAAGIATLYVALYRRAGIAVTIGCVAVVAALLRLALRPPTVAPYWVWAGMTVLFGVAVIACGMLARARRQVLHSLRDRAVRAETEQRMRTREATRAQRMRIAREMHDVLAHRLSLLAVHAGALEFYPGATEQEVATAAGIVRSNAQQALRDLREVVGVLREDEIDDVDAEVDRPQPTLADLPVLIAEARQAGTPVDLHAEPPDLSAVPVMTGRTAYRIIQETLTNARRHAPGAKVTITITGRANEGLEIEAHNHISAAAEVAMSSGGQGLVGLEERAALAGGRLRHELSADQFRLSAWLPWQP